MTIHSPIGSCCARPTYSAVDYPGRCGAGNVFAALSIKLTKAVADLAKRLFSFRHKG
jgi:hypothetical protein